MLLPGQLLVFADGGTLRLPCRQNGFVGTQPMARTVLSECAVHLHMGGRGPCKMSEAARECGCAVPCRTRAVLRSLLVSASATSHLPPSKAEQAFSSCQGLDKSALGLEQGGKGKDMDP